MRRLHSGAGDRHKIADNGEVPELLLKVATHAGNGALRRADYINRILTSGGVAATGSCMAGKTVKIP